MVTIYTAYAAPGEDIVEQTLQYKHFLSAKRKKDYV
jgi:hypothetical protein